MKIRTQLLLSASLALLATAIAGVTIGYAVQTAKAADAEQQLAQAAARETAGLLVLTQEYALHFEPRAEQQWRQRHAVLRSLLVEGQHASVDASTLAGLRSTSDALPSLFGRLAEVPQAEQTALTARRKEFLVDQLLTDTQALADGVYRWSRATAGAQRQAEQRFERYGIGAFVLMVVLLLGQTVLVMRRVLRPVMVLEEATSAIERGDFSARLSEHANDELGQLKRSFNSMTTALSLRTQQLAEEVERRHESEQRMRLIADNLPVMITYVDQNCLLRFCNETCRDWMGIDPQQSVGRAMADVLGPALYEERREHGLRALAGDRVSFDLTLSRGGVERRLHNVYIPDLRADGSVAGMFTLATDVTELKQVQDQLNEMARVDTLTGLPNRRQFEETLPMSVARSRREGRPMALLFIDVDLFKQINDEHGHGIGDTVLKEFADRLRGCVRVTDTVARLAGDEFVVILEGLHASSEAEGMARKIGSAMAPPFSAAALGLHVTSSIGVAFVDRSDVSANEVMAKADTALYRAKRAGRATFAVATWSGEAAERKAS